MKLRLSWLALAPAAYYLVGQWAYLTWWGVTIAAAVYKAGQRHGERLGGENMLTLLDTLVDAEGQVDVALHRLESKLTTEQGARVAAQREAAKERRQ